MSTDCVELQSEMLCGCCSGTERETPEAISNRPALPAIAYRAGRYATFNASMLAALSDPSFAAAELLRTRASSDFSIAVLDAWAVTLDVLTFYQERFANEAFLRTAVDQRSVFELAALVGYEPSPGVAASAVLAFTLSSAPGSPESVLIASGSRVQSVPGPGQMPQVFETSADLNARIAFNALPAQTAERWRLVGSDTSTWITGISNNINVGDVLLFVAAEAGEPLINGPGDVHFVTSVSIDRSTGNTQIGWDAPLVAEFAAERDSQQVCLYVMRRKAALYGAQAPNPQTLSGAHISAVPGYPNPLTNGWDYQYTDGSAEINLDAAYAGLEPQAGGPPQWIVLTGTDQGYTSFFSIERALDTNPGYYTLTTKTTQLKLALGGVLIGDPGLTLNELLFEFVKETPEITAYVQSAPLEPASLPLTAWTLEDTYQRAEEMLMPVAGASLAVVGAQQIAPGQPLGVSGKRLRLEVQEAGGAMFVAAGSMSGSAPRAGQLFIIESFPPSADPVVSGSLLWSVQTLSGVAGTLSVSGSPAAVVLLPADSADSVVGEAAVAQQVTVDGDVTTLTLTAALSRIYDAATVAVNANAVEATHGETVQEILGSGDGTNAALEFTLKQAPLTYLTASSGSGARSTLEVWVNNLQWSERADLSSCGPADRAFVTRANPAGNRAITFGDGVAGARTPTGTSNVRASYRKGIGSAGMVGAGQLSQPLDRPQGLSAVTNPGAASGAADPATAAEARACAPLPTLTIGRVVSLEDYQSFALAFAGIAKALASWTWFGDVRGVFLTVAGADGAILNAADPIVSALIEAIALYGEPYVPLRVAPHVPVSFTFTAAILVDQPEYDPEVVIAQAWQTLSSAFAFAVRDLGQGVAMSRIVELIQEVPGVIAVRLRGLGRSGVTPPATVPVMLGASGPQPPLGAQLLALDPATQGRIGLWS